MELLNYVTEYHRTKGSLPSLPIVNMYAEESLSEGKMILQSRSPLRVVEAVYPGPIRKLYAEPGVFNQDLFAVSENELFRAGASVGTVTGNGHPYIDSYSDTTFITAGGPLYKYDGTLSTIATVDSSDTLALVVLASRLVIVRKDTQRLFWSEPLGITIDALDFAEAETSPDKVLDILAIGDKLLVFGEGSVEFWTPSADPDTPFVPVVGRVMPKGIKNTGAATAIGSGFAWVTNTNQVCVVSSETVVSTREIEKDISESTTCKLWTFYLDNTEFLALTLDEKTKIFNPVTGSWSEFTSYGERNFEGIFYANGVFGSQFYGRTLEWSDDYSTADEVEVERLFRGWAPFENGTIVCHNVFLRTDVGGTEHLTGDFTSPTVLMRTSKNGGKTFTNWREESLGAQGSYRETVVWRAGMLLEFRVTDPVHVRISGILANEPYGGY